MTISFISQQAMEERTPSRTSQDWYFCNKRLPRGQITYFCQMIIIYIVIITSIVNLSINNGDKTLFITLLSSAVGVVLPTPGIKKSIKIGTGQLDQVV